MTDASVRRAKCELVSHSPISTLAAFRIIVQLLLTVDRSHGDYSVNKSLEILDCFSVKVFFG